MANPNLLIRVITEHPPINRTITNRKLHYAPGLPLDYPYCRWVVYTRASNLLFLFCFRWLEIDGTDVHDFHETEKRSKFKKYNVGKIIKRTFYNHSSRERPSGFVVWDPKSRKLIEIEEWGGFSSQREAGRTLFTRKVNFKDLLYLYLKWMNVKKLSMWKETISKGF